MISSFNIEVKDKGRNFVNVKCCRLVKVWRFDFFIGICFIELLNEL